jgi:hypothetical protein
MKSWKTSVAGGSALLVIISTTVKQLTDGDPNTNPDWNVVIPLLFTGLIGLFSRDNDKTSEDLGLKKEGE